MRSSAGSEQFFLDKQSEICQIFSSLQEFSARARRTQKSKITHSVHYIGIIGPFMHYFVIFRILDICVQAWGALRDLNIFFLTNNLRFVKYFLAWRTSLLEPAKYKSRKSHISCIISVYYDHSGTILSYFEVFWDLCLSTKSSAGFQNFFFDEPSETCQIFSSLEEFSAVASKIQKSKITHFHALYQYM